MDALKKSQIQEGLKELMALAKDAREFFLQPVSLMSGSPVHQAIAKAYELYNQPHEFQGTNLLDSFPGLQEQFRAGRAPAQVELNLLEAALLTEWRNRNYNEVGLPLYRTKVEYANLGAQVFKVWHKHLDGRVGNADLIKFHDLTSRHWKSMAARSHDEDPQAQIKENMIDMTYVVVGGISDPLGFLIRSGFALNDMRVPDATKDQARALRERYNGSTTGKIYPHQTEIRPELSGLHEKISEVNPERTRIPG